MEFDGDTDYLLVEDSDSLSVEGDMTIAAWANFVSFSNWNSIMVKGGVGGAIVELQLGGRPWSGVCSLVKEV